MLIISLLEPTFGTLENFSKSDASSKLIYFLVDISKSMNTTDIAPNRLEKAKSEIKKIANYFPGDRFGIIAFASEAHLHTALTSDIEIFKERTSALNTDFISVSGTNLEAALKLFIEKINSISLINRTSATAILFSDGEDFSDVSEQTLNDFKRRRINLFVVGIGTKKGGIVVDKYGKSVLNDNNKTINSKLETEYLMSITAKTNGKYFEYNDFVSPFSEITQNIGSLKGGFNTQSLNAATVGNKYHYPLILSVLLICFDLLFSIQIFSFKKEIN